MFFHFFRYFFREKTQKIGNPIHMFQYISNDNLTAILNPLNYVGDVNSTNHLLVCKSWRSAIRASPWDEAAKVI